MLQIYLTLIMQWKNYSKNSWKNIYTQLYGGIMNRWYIEWKM
jgi:hypothetical protein